MIELELLSLLENANGEREVAVFLQNNPWVALNGLVRFGDGSCIVSEFPLGSEFKADFVALAPFSAGWEIHFVELEPPNEKPFNKDGTMAKRLNQALAQIDSWRTYLTKHRETVLHDLARYAKDKDLIRGPRSEEPTCHVGWPIYHPDSWLQIHLNIVIGRRARLSDSDLEKKSSFADNHKIELMTYDRFVDAARHLDQRRY